MYTLGKNIKKFYSLGKEVKKIYSLGVEVYSSASTELPYIPVPYIQAVGPCRINTGIFMTQNPTIEMTLQKNTEKNIVHGFYASSAAQSVKSASNNVYTLSDQWTSPIVGSDATIKQTLTYSVNGTTVSLSSSLGGSVTRENVTILSTQNFKFFANRHDMYATYGEGLLFDSKIYVEGVLVRDYVTCMDPISKELGLWDKVNNKFEGNDTTSDITGHFITGDIELPQILTKDGLIYTTSDNLIFKVKG